MTCAAVPECRALATHLLTPGRRRRRRRHLVSIDSVTPSRRVASLIIHARCHHTTQAHGDANNDISSPGACQSPSHAYPALPLTTIAGTCPTASTPNPCHQPVLDKTYFTFLFKNHKHDFYVSLELLHTFSRTLASTNPEP